MLITPLPGTNRDNLIEVLRGEQTKVINLRGRHFGSAYQALLAYLSWSSDAVRMLRGQIRAADIDRLVLTRRHGALLDGVGHLAGSDQQAFVNGIVGLELDERIEEFEKAIKEYTALTERWNPPAESWFPTPHCSSSTRKRSSMPTSPPCSAEAPSRCTCSCP